MINEEKIFLTIIISICLLVCIVIVNAVVDLSVLTAYALGSVNSALDTIFGENTPPLQEDITYPLEEGWEFFRSEDYGFEIQFPKEVTRKSILNQDALNAGVGVAPESAVWEFVLENPSLYQGTNLVEASLLIHVLHDEVSINACTQFKPGSLYQSPNHRLESLPEIDINGTLFWKDEVLEGVMGEFYRRISYRTIYNQACYELTQLIHFQNSTAYLEEDISEYDEELVLAELDQVLGTFSLLDSNPSFPKLSYPELKSVSTAVTKDTSEYADGLDVSHWQGTINWTKVANANYIFTFAKGTEGVGWTDVKFHTNMNQGRDAGVFMGVYHFARPDLGNSGAAEANYFLSVAGDYLKSGYLRPVLDLEVGGSLGKTALSNWVLEWMETVKNRTGIEPLIYTNLYFINTYLTNAVTDYDLWIAYWTNGCDSTVTFDIPPTGKWNDWAFWQYCVAGPGTVPGILTSIDLNKFNGIKASLQSYDAASPLWISLVSDTNTAPVPYYADLTADVNGDAVGLMDYYFWWNCDSLDVEIASVESACGILPRPTPGECMQNSVGMTCFGQTEDVQLAEHTYQEIANITAKVIITREGKIAEDRFQITTINPIRSILISPESPGQGSINQKFDVNVEVRVTTTVSGSLQAEIVEHKTGTVQDSECIIVPSDEISTENFSLSVPWSTSGATLQEIWVRYRPGGICDVFDSHEYDQHRIYEIYWPQSLNDSIGFYDPVSLMWREKIGNYAIAEVNRFIWGPYEGAWFPLTGDWDGDGVDTVGFYDPLTKMWKLNVENDTPTEIHRFIWGPFQEEWIPLTGDWDGDGIDTIGFYDPVAKMWKLNNENDTPIEIQRFIWGPSEGEWIPLTGDWDGDGVDTVGFYDQASKTWRLINENNTPTEIQQIIWGPSIGDWYPLTGDWDGDGVDTVGFYDPVERMWKLIDVNERTEEIYRFFWGITDTDWIPITGDWN
ncbi:MAG: GH25 family lysozyme [Anaerolineales bacterium]